MRFLYFGDPDEHGEYPVLFIDHDDLPTLGVEWPGFDVWLAEALDLKIPASAKRQVAETSKRILGSKNAWSLGSKVKLPAPRPGPKPGSVTFAAITPPPAEKPRKLTDRQLSKVLGEIAELGDAVRLATLIADAKNRNLPQAAFDDALVAAARFARQSTMRLLLEAGAHPDAREYSGSALSRLISHGGSPAAAQLLLDAGASANVPSMLGTTALFEAVEKGSLEMARLLLERGADANHADERGMTPLLELVRTSVDPAILDLLLQHGAALEGGTHASRALHCAIEYGRLEMARRLLARGANIDAKDDRGRTALHIAFERGEDEFAAELVRAGADRAIADERGITLTEVFGPNGEDVRPLDVHYVPSDYEQLLTITARLAVIDPSKLQYLPYREIDAGYWVGMIEHGLAASSMFDPTKSTAKVARAYDAQNLQCPGIHEATIELSVAGVAPEWLRFVARRLSGRVMAFPGAAIGSAVRPIGVSIRGSREGTSAVDEKTLRAWLTDDTVQLGRFASVPPFELRCERGAVPGLLVRPTSFSPEIYERISAVCQTWLEMSEMWPRTRSGSARYIVLSPDVKAKNAAVYAFLAPAAEKGERNVFPFATEPALAALENAMRSLHAKTPLAEVVLTIGE